MNRGTEERTDTKQGRARTGMYFGNIRGGGKKKILGGGLLKHRRKSGAEGSCYLDGAKGGPLIGGREVGWEAHNVYDK